MLSRPPIKHGLFGNRKEKLSHLHVQDRKNCCGKISPFHILKKKKSSEEAVERGLCLFFCMLTAVVFRGKQALDTRGEKMDGS